MHLNRMWRALALIGLVATLNAIAQNDDTDNTLTLPEMVVTASRTQRAVDTVPANILVITAEDIAKSNATTVPDLLRRQANIQVADYLGNGATTTVGIGGFGETGPLNVVVLVDGLRVDYADLAGPDFGAVPLNQVQRIEVLRSGNSSLYGNGSTGGVINIITKAGGQNKLQMDAEATSWSYREATELSGKAGDLGYIFKQGYTDSDGYRFNNHYRSKNFHLGLDWDPKQADWFGISLRSGRNQETFGLAGAMTDAAMAGVYDRRDTRTPNDWQTQTTKYVSLVPRFQLDDGAHRIQVPMTYRERDVYVQYDFGFYWLTEWRDVVQGIAPQWTWEHELAGRSNSLTVGVELYQNDKHGITNTIESHRQTTDFFVNDTLEVIDNVFLDLSYRRGRTDFDFEGGFDQDLHFDEDAWHAGLTWNYQEGSKLYGFYDHSYRVGVLDEYIVYPAWPGAPFVSTGLKPQLTDTWKMGVSHSFEAPVTLGAAVFRIDTDDEIFYDPNDPTYNIFFPGNNRNYDETHRLGAVLELDVRPAETVRVFANYTWLDAEFGSDSGPANYDGNTIPLVPEHAVNGGVEWQILKQLTWNLTGRWRDTRYTLSDWNNNMSRLGSYAAFDTRLSYDWRWFTFYAGVNNLGDEKYSEFTTYGTNHWPAVGRQFFGGVRATWTF